LRGVFRQFRRTRNDHSERLRPFLVLVLLSSLQQTLYRPRSSPKIEGQRSWDENLAYIAAQTLYGPPSSPEVKGQRS